MERWKRVSSIEVGRVKRLNLSHQMLIRARSMKGRGLELCIMRLYVRGIDVQLNILEIIAIVTYTLPLYSTS